MLILPSWIDAWVCLSTQKWAKTHVFVSYLRNVNSQQAKRARKSSDATSDELRCGSRHLPMGASKRVPRADPRKKALVNPSSCCHTWDTSGSLPLALPGRISFEHPRVRGRSLVCGRRGESLFSLLLLQQSGSVCLTACECVCECVNVRVGRASSRFPPHQLSRPLRTVPPSHVQ